MTTRSYESPNSTVRNASAYPEPRVLHSERYAFRPVMARM